MVVAVPLVLLVVCCCQIRTRFYYLRPVEDYQWLAYPPKLTVELGSYVDGEAHGWAR
jgi:hypothetical protein